MSEHVAKKATKLNIDVITNIMIAVGLLFVIIPAVFWSYEAYSQWSQVKKWEPVISLYSDDTMREIRYSQNKNDAKQSAVATSTAIAPAAKPVTPIPAARLVDTGTVARGASVALIEIPKLKLKLNVTEGEDWANLAKGPVRVSKTAKIGEIGTTLISGHRTMYGAPFKQFHQLAIGDKVVIYTKKAAFIYIVDGIKRVYPDDWGDIRKPTDASRLALSTCDPMFSAKKRLLILCRLDQAKLLNQPGT